MVGIVSDGVAFRKRLILQWAQDSYRVAGYLLIGCLTSSCIVLNDYMSVEDRTGAHAPPDKIHPIKPNVSNTSQRGIKESHQEKNPTHTFTKNSFLYHRVSPGDTLYSIAWHCQLDVKQLAHINKIQYPYTIYPGQDILLGEMKTFSRASSCEKNQIQQQNIQIASTPTSTKNKKQKLPSEKHDVNRLNESVSDWFWPIYGDVISPFSNVAPLNKGVDIRSQPGQKVLAAASGSIVYAGSGLRGYGKLVIIKHNESFLSAYANNGVLLVKEGDSVKAKQEIAQVGNARDRRKTTLHFQIRRNGLPVDPETYLPRR